MRLKRSLTSAGLGIVGIEVGQRDQRDDLAGADVEHHAGGGDGAVAGQRIGQLLVHDVLDAQVDREIDRRQLVAARKAELLEQRDVLAVHVLFDAGDALVVDVDRAEDVRGLVAAGIEPLALGDEVEPGNAEAEDALLLRRRQLALDPDEALVAGQPLAQPVADRGRAAP